MNHNLNFKKALNFYLNNNKNNIVEIYFQLQYKKTITFSRSLFTLPKFSQNYMEKNKKLRFFLEYKNFVQMKIKLTKTNFAICWTLC